MAVTHKDLDALKTIVTNIETEKAAIEIRLQEANGNYYGAKREFTRNEKPTPAMLRLLQQVADGGVINEDRYNSYCYYIIDKSGFTSRITNRLFYGLRNRETIDEAKRYDGYHVTEHGREVLVKHGGNKPKK